MQCGSMKMTGARHSKTTSISERSFYRLAYFLAVLSSQSEKPSRIPEHQHKLIYNQRHTIPRLNCLPTVCLANQNRSPDNNNAWALQGA